MSTIRPAIRKSLTDLAVKAAKPDTRPFTIYDTKQGHLALMIYPSGRKTYKCRYSRHGRARWYHIGSTSAVGLADARKLAAGIMLDVVSGKDPHADRQARRGDGTFREMIESYIKERGSRSMKQYERQLRKWALPRWGRLPVGEVTKKDVGRLFEQRKRASPASAKLLLAAVSGAFSWALYKDWPGIVANPAHNVAMVKFDESLRAPSRERVLSDPEIVAFWTALEQTGLLACMALKTVLLTGQRPGEVSTMRWEDIDGSWWHMPAKPDGKWRGTKNARRHKCYLTPAVFALLEEASGDRRTGLVFRSERGNPVGHLPAAMSAACKALGIEVRARPHDLRRTHGTLTTKLGFERDAMDRVMNHIKRRVGGVYDKNTYADEARAIQETIGRHIAGLLTGDGNVIDLAARR